MTYIPTTRKPTGVPAAPLVIVSGLAKSGKSMTAYKLALSSRIDWCGVVDMGEGSAEEYGGDPTDPPYEIIDWGTTWSDLEDTVRWAIAKKPADGKLNGLIIDSGTELWFNLGARANKRARSSKAALAKLRDDPNTEIDTQMTHWNDAKTTWARIISPMKMAPNLVGVVIVRSEIVAEVVGGQPTKNKIVSYQCEKTLQGAATAHINVDMEHKAHLIEVRSKYVSVTGKGLELGDNPMAEMLDLLSPTGSFGAADVKAPYDDGRDDPEVEAFWARLLGHRADPIGDQLRAFAAENNRELTKVALGSDPGYLDNIRALLDSLEAM